MAPEKKQAKVLTKNEQKQSIKGTQKSKKNIIKNYLESPFALEWPDVTPVHEEEITALIHKSCSGLKKIECKPPWKELAQYKGDDRKTFLKEYKKNFEENLDPDNREQNNKRKEALSHLILGYNAAMRALEKDRIAGILVKKNVDPGFVTKSFLPGCAKKNIPVIPLNNLDKLLKDAGTLDLPHACMVLGLKTTVKDKSNQFHLLYMKMCEALHVEEEEVDEDITENNSEDEDMKCASDSAVNDQKNHDSKSFKLSAAEIRSYHLKRNTTNGRRAFIPHAQESDVNNLDSSMDFLSFKAAKGQESTNKQREVESKEVYEDKSKNEFGAIDENLDLSSMILIDASGDENQCIESDTPKEKISDAQKLNNNDSHRVKRKANKNNSDPYVFAKTKRVRGNPDRKINN